MSANVSTLPKPRTASRPAARRLFMPVASQRRVAKAGMALSLGVLVWSALAGRRVLHRYHVLAGVALLGFSAWHMGLYRQKDAVPASGRRRT